MFDIELRLQHQPGELARMGEALGQAGVSVEGGGMFVVNDVGVAHFLVKDADTARAALEAAGMQVAACRSVLPLRLEQDEPGLAHPLRRRHRRGPRRPGRVAGRTPGVIVAGAGEM